MRQGRAFGIHVLLGSQTLGGAYTVARTTLGQMVIRIALQCNEADAYLIMDDNNPAPRLLSRPGRRHLQRHGRRDRRQQPLPGRLAARTKCATTYLAKVQARAVAKSEAKRREGRYPGPIVFEGNAPADVRENPLLRRPARSRRRQAGRRRPASGSARPTRIKGPTEAVFHRQSGNNLLLVGQREEATLAMLSRRAGLPGRPVSRSAPRGSSCAMRTPPGTPQREFLERVIQAIPHPITLAKHERPRATS